MLVLLSLILFISGCWNRRELNDLAIAVGLGIDASADGQYEVLMQIVDPGEISSQKTSSSRAPVTIYRAKGRTLFKAIRRLTKVTPRKVYLSHLRMMIMSEKVARKGIGKILDFMLRDQMVGPNFNIVIAKGHTAKEIMSIFTPLDKIPVNKMYRSLNMSDRWFGSVITVKLDELISNITSEGKKAVLSGITISGDSERGKDVQNVEGINTEALLKYTTIGLFQGDRLVGWFNETESIGFMMLTDKLQGTIINIPCSQGGLMGIELVQSKTKVKGIVRNHRPEIYVDIQAEGNIADVECKVDLCTQATIRQLQQVTAQKIIETAKKALKRAKKKNADVFGFGETIHQAYPHYWSRHKEKWNVLFKDLPVYINVTFTIKQLGALENSFLNQVKE